MLRTLTCLLIGLLLAPAVWADDEPRKDADAAKARLKVVLAHMQSLDVRQARGNDAVPLRDVPVLVFGDSARANGNGTLWAFGKTGRPLAMLELYQPTGRNENWIHAVSLTSPGLVALKTPLGSKWTPEKSQITPQLFPKADKPAAKETVRLRQLKEMSRRFTAHEFWDPENSRFELRLLVQPVLRYQDAKSQIQDGAVFALAHRTNPEVVVLIEAIGNSPEEAKWHYGLARMGSAEMHVAIDDEEVWKVDRAVGVVGKPTDPYWLFVAPARDLEP